MYKCILHKNEYVLITVSSFGKCFKIYDLYAQNVPFCFVRIIIEDNISNHISYSDIEPSFEQIFFLNKKEEKHVSHAETGLRLTASLNATQTRAARKIYFKMSLSGKGLFKSIFLESKGLLGKSIREISPTYFQPRGGIQRFSKVFFTTYLSRWLENCFHFLAPTSVQWVTGYGMSVVLLILVTHAGLSSEKVYFAKCFFVITNANCCQTNALPDKGCKVIYTPG